ncbi:hypothetical protein IJ098_00630 [Candidatus Saccharibacteria bacterium]|nr:hypothetical protein [Candidatus Saccharibacteria bacterium]
MMENIYAKTLSEVLSIEEEKVEPTSERDFYEKQLADADIPDEQLFNVYVALKDEFGGEMENLSSRYWTLSRELASFYSGDDIERYVDTRKKADRVNYFAYGILTGIIVTAIFVRIFYKESVQVALQNIISREGAVSLMVFLVASLVAYFATRSLLEKRFIPQYKAEYEEKYCSLKKEYEETERKYHDRKMMLDVARRACQAKKIKVEHG